MRSTLIITGAFLWAGYVCAQDSTNTNGEEVKDSTSIGVVNPKEAPKKTTAGDTTHIRLGKKGITIVERDGKTTVDIATIEKDTLNVERKHQDNWDKVERNDEHWNKEEGDEHWEKKSDFHWKGKRKWHFAGVELGLNNYVTASNSFNLNPKDRYMSANTSISMVCNVNIFEYPFPVTKNSAIITGLGFGFNNYRFDGDSTNIKKEDGNIVKRSLNETVEKSKIKMTYINIPLLYEYQIPINSTGKPLYISAGIIAGIKIYSSSKVEYKNSTDQNWSDLNLVPFRLGYQARIGYEHLNLFATYYATPLFMRSRGPELYPVEVGLMLINF